MTLPRRSLLLAALATPALGQPAPRPIKLVIPFPAGGSTDVIGRTLAEALRPLLATQVIIENRPGAGGNIGAEQVARATPDGTELLLASVSHATNHHLLRNQPFHPIRDFAPISLVATVPNALLVRTTLAASDINAFIALARAAQAPLTYGSAGIGTSAHLAAALFERLAGVRMEHVPYRGTGPALTDLVAGRLDLMFDIVTAAIPRIQDGQVRALGITSLEPSPILPSLVPIAATLPGYAAETWNGLYAPARTPPETVARLNAATSAALADPAVIARLAQVGVTPIGGPPETLATYLAQESEKWGQVIREGNIRGD